MDKLTKLSFLGLTLVTMLGLSACGDVKTTAPLTSYSEVTVTMKDGRSMPCIGHSNALDCDWSQLKK